MPVFLLLISLLHSFASEACEHENGPAHTSYWKKLIHYQWTPIGYKSEVDGADFFLSAEGKSCPEKEFEATVQKSTDPLIVCRFPARYKWLNEIGATKADLSVCKDFILWKDGLSAKSLSLVFASYYPENPASAFGHLFLKINHEEKGHLSELDYVVNFSAATEEDSGIMYAIKGLFGGYKGVFSIEKYYQKIQEYEIHETRDLWEFPLKLTPEEVERVLNHLWELTYSSYFDYYFLDENCSYQIVKLMELARNEEYESFWGPYQIPEENLHQVVERLGLSANESVRFSLFKQTEARLKKLSQEEKRKFHQVRKGKLKDYTDLSPLTLDTLSQYYQLKEAQNKGASAEDKIIRFEILKQISKVENPPEIIIKNADSPLKGHRSTRISLNSGRRLGENFYGLKGKPAFHDFMDDDRGYLPNSSLNIMAFDLRYLDVAKKFRLNELILVETMVLSPRSFLSTKPSWGADFSLRSPFQFNCDYCQVAQLKLSRGMAKNYFDEKLIPYIYLHGIMQEITSKDSGMKQFRYGPELEVGLCMRLQTWWKFRSAIFASSNFTDSFSYQNFLTKNDLAFFLSSQVSISLAYKKSFGIHSTEIKKAQESDLNLNYYF